MGLFSNPSPINDDLISDEKIQNSLELRVQDEDGVPHSLGSVLKGNERTILIFIRHHHCGACMSYVTNLSDHEKFKQTAISSSSSTTTTMQQKTKVIIIGHGSFEGIEWYKKNAITSFQMYVDESKKVHEAFGFTHRYLGKPEDSKPDYFNGKSMAQVTMSSIKRGIFSGSLALKGGDIALLGGEVVLDKDLHCLFVHRMRDTQDHTPVDKLAEYVIA